MIVYLTIVLAIFLVGITWNNYAVQMGKPIIHPYILLAVAMAWPLLLLTILLLKK
jgi:hypothetical protein